MGGVVMHKLRPTKYSYGLTEWVHNDKLKVDDRLMYAQLITKNLSHNLEKVDLEMFCSCKEIRSAVKNSTSDYDKEKLQERLCLIYFCAENMRRLSHMRWRTFATLLTIHSRRKRFWAWRLDILKALEFELSGPTIKTFLRRFITKVGQEDIDASEL